MAKPSASHPAKGWIFHAFAVLCTLIAAEALSMLCAAPLMRAEPGSIVIAGIMVLPLWGTLLALVLTAGRRLRALVIVVGIAAVSTALLLLA